jgi:DNA mismatch endonuclease (patch repair protein)
MADVFSVEKRSAVMRAIRSKDTKPEMAIRSALHRMGFRFKLHSRKLPGKPDVVLPRFATAIQVRGCFWHGHTCADGRVPKSRFEYWGPKLAANKRRDKKNDASLRKLGWSVLVVWECRCSGYALDQSVARIIKHLSRKRPEPNGN